uniref:3'-5' exonuclease domain-containing protein n=1 Tax=Caenorhabditis japonica TaxID=281687 RepID=A0A8R1DS77_CAEJA
MSEGSAEASISYESTGDKNSWKLAPWIEVRRNQLKELMKSTEEKKEEIAAATFFQFFDEDFEYCQKEELERGESSGEKKNFYKLFLKMFRSMPVKNKYGGKSLSHWFLKHFIGWVEEKEIERNLRIDYMSEEITELALYRASKDLQFSNNLHRIFDITPAEQKERVLKLIRENISVQNYKKAADIAVNNGVVDKFSFKELVLPLILCDRVQVAWQLLAVSKTFQKEYIQFLDQFVAQPDEFVDSYFEPYKDQLKTTLDRYKGKNLIQLIQRFFTGPARQFKFDLEEAIDAPRFDLFGKQKALRYYIGQRWVENTMKDAAYCQHVKSIFQNKNYQLLHFFLNDLWDRKKKEFRIDAISWMIHYDISQFEYCVPHEMQKFFRNPHPNLIEHAYQLIELRNEQDVPNQNEQLYVYEKEKKFPIKWVKTENEFDEFCSILKAIDNVPGNSDTVFIGYDSEMKNVHFMAKDSMPVALIQLFLHDTAYLIDCVELDKIGMNADRWTDLMHIIFDSMCIKLVGFDIRNDMEVLFGSSVLNSTFKVEDIKNELCLKNLIEKLTELDNEILKIGTKTCKLNTVVQSLLGLEMDKSEQCSNWEYRPLRKDQIVYAAMDAVIVIELFQKVHELAKEKGIGMEQLIQYSSPNAPRKEKLKRDNRKLDKISWEELYEVLHTHRNTEKPLKRPSELKLIMDLMLFGLGKNLRRFGVDTIHPKGVYEFNEIAAKNKLLPLTEQRLIITVPTKKLDELKLAYEDHLVIIPSTESKTNLEILCDFFDFFNLDIRLEDNIFEGTADSSKSNESIE